MNQKEEIARLKDQQRDTSLTAMGYLGITLSLVVWIVIQVDTGPPGQTWIAFVLGVVAGYTSLVGCLAVKVYWSRRKLLRYAIDHWDVYCLAHKNLTGATMTYQSGIQTVVAVLRRASRGHDDHQLRVVEAVGRAAEETARDERPLDRIAGGGS